MTAAGTPPPARRRAVVLSGGGAKGVFESGVLHALHRAGYEPDVVTGSSVGAVNAAAYAEIIRARREEGDAAAEERVESLLRLWQRLDRARVADLDRWGKRVWVAWLALHAGALVLAAAAVGPLWSWIAGSGDLAQALWGAARITVLALALGLAIGAWVLLLQWLALPFRLRESVRRGMTGSAELTRHPHAPPSAWQKLWLRLLGVYPALFTGAGLERALLRLVPAERRFGDYRKAALDLRLTRTNLRTGRTEISERVTAEDLRRPGAERGRRVPGDPRVVPAALASAAFPGAFPTVPVERLYPEEENAELHGAFARRSDLAHALVQYFGPRTQAEVIWLSTLLDDLAEEDPTLLRVGREGALRERLKERFAGDHLAWQRVPPDTVDALVDTRHWPDLPLPGAEHPGDRYFDGGVLDNTPLSTAVAALRDRQAGDAETGAAPAAGEDESAPVHEVLVVLVSPPPRRKQLMRDEAEFLEGPAVALRALRLQAEQRLATDARNAERIDRLLAARGEMRRLRGAPESAPPRRAWSGDGETVPPLTLDVPVPEILARVAVTRVVPSWDLPWVLALDDRLGFTKGDAMKFQARGCRDALQALARGPGRRRSAEVATPRHEQRAAALVGEIPPAGAVPPGWKCRVERCSLRGPCDELAGAERTARERGEAAAP